MSLLKNWKLILAAMSVAAMFTACAGSSGGSDDGDDTRAAAEEGYDEPDNATGADASNGGSGKKASAPKKQEPPKEVIDENKLKKAEGEAMAVNEENHKLRKEIFDTKIKLGMSTAEEADEAAAAEASE